MRQSGTSLLSFLLFLFLGATVSAVTPATPHIINYQGRITDGSGTPISDGPHGIRLIIWNDSTSTNPLNIIWDSGPLSVTTDKGLFTVKLGAPPQPSLSPSSFQDSSRWLGITVGADPEMSPRTRFTSVPYAFTAENAVTAPGYLPLTGGTMTGSTTHSDVMDTWTWTGNARVRISPIDGSIITYGSDNQEQIRLWDGSWGELQLHNDQPSNGLTAMLTGVANSGLGGGLWLWDQAGITKVYMDAGASGTNSVYLPDSAIDAREILDEPGVASAQNTATTTLTCSGVSNLLSVSITIPAAGYIVVDGRCNVESASSTGGTIGGGVGISESSSTFPSTPYYGYFNQQLPAGGFYFIDYPLSCYRIFYKASAGTYTFYLNGTKFGNCPAGYTSQASSPMMKATYYSTSYGTVTTLVGADDRPNFEQSTPVQLTDEKGKPTGETAYQVDLRELELKAAKLRADAEAAQRQLAEARLKQQQQQNSQTVR